MTASRPHAQQMMPPSWSKVAAPGTYERTWSDGSHAAYADPSVSREHRLLAQGVMSDRALQAAQQTYAQLRLRLVESNPLRFFIQMEAWNRMLRRLPVEKVYGYEALVEFVGGLVASLPAQTVMSARDTVLTFDDFLEMERLVRQFANFDAEAKVGDFTADTDERHLDARYFLSNEQQFDRMGGYVQHLRRIAERVFEPFDTTCIGELGATPTGVLSAADVFGRHQEDLALGALDRLRTSEVRPSDGLAHFERVTAALAIGIGADPVLAIMGATGLTEAETRRTLDTLATKLGSQNVTRLSSKNRLRHFPVLSLPDGSYLWANPLDFVHEALDWFDAFLVESTADRLRERLSLSRSNATETLAAEAFESVFGPERCQQNIEYHDRLEDWVETDLLIDLGTAAIVVEAKAHRVTAAGRAGAPGRVRTKFAELVDRPLQQTQRAREALRRGCELRDVKKRPVPSKPVEHVARCVVHLDRVDPLVTFAHDHVAAPTDGWIVSLADLLTVTAILTHPAELYGYIEARSAQTATGSPVVFMETDALGAWLRTREGAWPTEEGAVFQLAYSSDAINRYFTDEEMHGRHPELLPPPTIKPSTSVPPTVLAVLDKHAADEAWPTAALAISQVQPETWRKVIRDLARFARTTQTRHARRKRSQAERGYLIGPQLHLAFGPDSSLFMRGEVVHLVLSASPTSSP